MAKQMKKALCVILSVIMAVSCFALGAYAYTGYDHDGTNSSLKVQTVVTLDKSSYSVGDTVTATITLNHPSDSVVGFTGVLAYDSSVLTYSSAALASGFEYYSDAFIPAATAIDVSELTNGYGGSAMTMRELCRMMGTETFTALSGVPIVVQNLTGLEAGSGDEVITLTFEATGNVEASNISFLPSVVYSPSYGYFNCAASTSTDEVYATSYAAIKASNAFEVTGGSGTTSYDITFNWHDGSSTITVDAGQTPAAPSVSDYSEGDYDYAFDGWNPAISAASANTTYTAQYTSTFVSADYTAYNAAVSAATAKRDNGTSWTADSLSALATALDTDVSGLGRTSQSTVDAQTAAINAAADALVEEAASVYNVTFAWQNASGAQSDTKQYEAGSMPVVPEGATADYETTDYSFTFTGWDKEIAAVTGTVTYTAQYSSVAKAADTSALATAIAAAEEITGADDYSAKYTSASKSALDAALAAAKALLAEAPVPSRQGEVNSATEALNSAVGALAINKYTITYAYKNASGEDASATETVSYGETPSNVPETPSYSSGDYDFTFNSWNPQISPATADVTYTAQYDSAFVSADYTAVNEAVARANALDLSTYTDDSVANLQSVLNSINYELGRTAQSTVNGYVTAVDNAIAALESKGANYTAYNTAVANLQAELAKTDAYTPASISAVTAALAEIDNALDKNLDIDAQGTVDAATAQVNALFAQLEQQADKAALQAAYNSASEKAESGLYTPVSVEALQSAMTAAKAVLDNGDATAAEISSATTALNNAINALVKKADKDALNAAIDRAEALNAQQYVDFSAVTAALETAKAVKDDDNATVEEVATATTALNNAIDALQMKGADYTAWNELVNNYKDLDTSLYTPETVAAVKAVLAKVKEAQEITYQDTLDGLTAELSAAIDGLQYLTAWEGETDWNGVNHEYFYANIDFVQRIDEETPSNIVVDVYLNHPVDNVAGIQLALAYDAAAMNYGSVSINNGSLIYDSAADGVLRFAADFSSVLPAATGSKNLIATLNFTSKTDEGTTVLALTKLADNTEVGHSVYSALLDAEGNEKFMHNDPATIALGKAVEPETGSLKGNIVSENGITDITVTLANGENTYTTVVKGENTEYSFSDVAPGTYTVTIAAPGSLGYTINDVEVVAGTDATAPEVSILFGDVDGNGTIDVSDISTALLESNYASASHAATTDVNGDGNCDVSDVSIILTASHYGKSASSQVMSAK